MARVLRRGGSLLIANLTSFWTAGSPNGWQVDAEGAGAVLHRWVSGGPGGLGELAGIRVRNWHRPLSQYMRLLLGSGLVLRYFDEPAAEGADAGRVERYRRVPFFHVMEWEKV